MQHKISELTFENFKKITCKNPILLRGNGNVSNLFLELSVTPTGAYNIDMFYDQELREECNRIFAKEEIHRLSTVLLKIYKFINMVKEEKCNKD